MNGIALKDGEIKWVTMAAATDTKEGWRDRRRDGGLVMDVTSNSVVLDGLCPIRRAGMAANFG